MANRYAEALGIWEHKIGDIEHKIKPKKGDNYKLSKVMAKSRDKTSSLANVIEDIGKLYYEMVLRDYQGLEDEEKRDLEVWVEMNAMQIMKDMLVAFKWATKEDMDKMVDSDAAKKLIDGA